MILASLIPRSLKARLFWASVVLLPVVIVFAAAALQRAFHNSLRASEASQARLHVYLLLGEAELRNGRIWLPDSVQEPRFSQVQSGLYATVHSRAGELLWRSPSSELLSEELMADLPSSNLEPGQTLFRHLAADGLFLFQYPVVWEGENGEQRFLVSVMHSDDSVNHEMQAFATQLWGWLGGVYLLALLMQFLIMRWGLKPLDHLAEDLSQIEQGQSDKLKGTYPLEVQAVTDNLNRLIESERRQRERYRNTLGDLAHSLKTPLAVMKGAADEMIDSERYRQLVDEQTSRMTQIVQYQLSRAVKSPGAPLAQPVAVEPVITRILSALSKVYADKHMVVRTDLEAGISFAGDEHDLMELLGNILENAFKYGESQVLVRGRQDGALLVLEVADDGPGVSADRRQTILERGARLDSSAPGQGIGLSVAVDILSSYDGALEIRDSADLSGAAFLIQLPTL
ncbi:Sensor protein PhoQ [Marinobacterium lacunae]|uniref:histidine kinase n=1 Tax=Marinobacterium lacunae TaxID=1232683 RepID=A0A081FXV4_9GAMM|nr:ATP-binding protein [Marinobacterium lacunae]KEA63359.1 Sensor protein PhoQ [Marinobacterium lacunae]